MRYKKSPLEPYGYEGARIHIAQWKKDGAEEKVRELTCQNLMVSQPCALLRWMKDNRPEIYGKIGTIFEAKDYIRYRLTGVAKAELTDYSLFRYQLGKSLYS